MIGREGGHRRAPSAGWLLAVLLGSKGCVMEVDVGSNGTTAGDDDDDVEFVDRDLDGFSAADGDCDDFDPKVGPANAFTESCDGLDNDCSGLADVDGQGVRVCARHDRFVQSLALDLLLVSDRSASAQPILEQAADAIPDLVKHLVGPRIDTHIGVVSMDMSTSGEEGRLVDVGGRRFVSGATDSLMAATSFLTHALGDLGVQTSGPEGGRAALDAALFLQAEGWNAGFARNSTPLVVIFLSNDEDRSVAPSIDELVDVLDATRGISRVTLHAVVQDSAYDCDGLSAPQSQGKSYADLAGLTTGFLLSMCEEDYAPFFSAVGQYAAGEGLQTRFLLGAPAQLETMDVEVRLPDGGATHHLAATDFALTDEGRTLVLLSDPLPPAGSEIVVDYDLQY